jgi:hypothetical protein
MRRRSDLRAARQIDPVGGRETKPRDPRLSAVPSWRPAQGHPLTGATPHTHRQADRARSAQYGAGMLAPCRPYAGTGCLQVPVSRHRSQGLTNGASPSGRRTTPRARSRPAGPVRARGRERVLRELRTDPAEPMTGEQPRWRDDDRCAGDRYSTPVAGGPRSSSGGRESRRPPAADAGAAFARECGSGWAAADLVA